MKLVCFLQQTLSCLSRPKPGARCCLSCSCCIPLAIPTLGLLESAKSQPHTCTLAQPNSPKNQGQIIKNVPHAMGCALLQNIQHLNIHELIANGEGRCLSCFLCTLDYKLPAELPVKSEVQLPLFLVGIQGQKAACVPLKLLSLPSTTPGPSRYSNYLFLSNETELLV